MQSSLTNDFGDDTFISKPSFLTLEVFNSSRDDTLFTMPSSLEIIPHNKCSYLWPTILEMIPWKASRHLWRWYLENHSVISGDDTWYCQPSSLTQEEYISSGDDTMFSQPSSLEMIPHDIRSHLWPKILEMIPWNASHHLWRWYLENCSVITGDDTVKSKPSSLEMTTLKYMSSALTQGGLLL